MIGTKLEQAIIDVMKRMVTEENKDEMKKYFEDMTVSGMIDEMFE